MCGNFDIVLDQFSRIPQLYVTLHALRDALHLVPTSRMLIGALRSDVVSKLGLQGTDHQGATEHKKISQQTCYGGARRLFYSMFAVNKSPHTKVCHFYEVPATVPFTTQVSATDVDVAVNDNKARVQRLREHLAEHKKASQEAAASLSYDDMLSSIQAASLETDRITKTLEAAMGDLLVAEAVAEVGTATVPARKRWLIPSPATHKAWKQGDISNDDIRLWAVDYLKWLGVCTIHAGYKRGQHDSATFAEFIKECDRFVILVEDPNANAANQLLPISSFSLDFCRYGLDKYSVFLSELLHKGWKRRNGALGLGMNFTPLTLFGPDR